jgi:hypothetical protein
VARTGAVAVALCVVLSSGLAFAQAPGEMPKPGPEHKKLGYFVGTWKAEGNMMPNPFMPAGKFTTTDRCEWFEGGFSVVCHSEGEGPMGPMTGIGIMGYSTEEKVYTYYGIDNGPMAMTSVPRGTIEGNTWTYDDESEMGGKTVKSRYVLTQESPSSYTFKWEMLGEDGSWQTVMHGKSTKTM